MNNFFANVIGIIRSVFKNPFQKTILLDGRASEPIGQAFPAIEASGPIEVSKLYKWAFIATLVLTVIFFLTSVMVANQGQPLSVQQEDLFKNCTTAWQMGFGAIIGLIGGKAIN